jgi:hypothetical protein
MITPKITPSLLFTPLALLLLLLLLSPLILLLLHHLLLTLPHFLLPLHLHDDIGIIIMLLSTDEAHSIIASGGDDSVWIQAPIVIVSAGARGVAGGSSGFSIHETFEFGGEGIVVGEHCRIIACRHYFVYMFYIMSVLLLMLMLIISTALF